MTFNSITYAIFLLGFLGIYWFLARTSATEDKSTRTTSFSRAAELNRSKKLSRQLWALVIASLIFYASLQIQYIPLLLIITLINFSIGKAIGANTAPGAHATNQRLSNEAWQRAQQIWNRRRLRLLGLGIVLNVIGLLSFKYLPFILNNLAAVLGLPIAREGASWLSTHLIAPLGLSFYTFECIAYLIDVYRGAPATDQLLQFSAYKLFFPKLISGPITRYHQFAAELKTLHFPSTPALTEGLWLIACGAVKKALLADRLGILVDLCFGNLERAGSGDLWLALVAYGLQLYLDFSGYVDIARGSAILMGFNLPENFDFPYFSTSIADFWRRWHITLGDWIRNYLYFPLGGSRQGLARTCFNLLIVMLITGIWHGAAWGFVVWGVLHGLALAVHRLTQSISEQIEGVKHWWQSGFGVLVAWFLTQFMVFTSWIFFRLPNLKEAGLVVRNLWGHSADVQFAYKVYIEALGLERFQIALLLATLVASMGLVFLVQRGLKLQLNWPLKLLLVPLCLYAIWVLAPEGGLRYIYFDF
ncbi:MAG TPA: MBOAT family protein [Waterburya sp.]|jgi:alginate O-acetyltransferase complex protein AlgI